MSTHCTIAMQNKDGSVDMVTCQMDGYLGYTGQILRQHYWKETKLRKLIALGNISTLAASLKQTMFYHRDFKEPVHLTCMQHFASLEEYKCKAWLEEYNYINVIRDDFMVGAREWQVYMLEESISFSQKFGGNTIGRDNLLNFKSLVQVLNEKVAAEYYAKKNGQK